MAILGFALAALIGLSLGVLGGGGSILTVPVFVYVLGYAAKPAIAMSLPVVGMTSLVGALRHWRAGNVNPRVALVFGVVTMTGAYLGARLAVFVSGTVQLGLLGAVMLAAAISMLRGRAPVDDGESSGAMEAELRKIGPMLAVGLGVGVLTGLVGIGGGFLIVPALVLLARVPMKQAIGTSLLVIAMNSASGFAGYLGQAVIPWDVLALFTTVAVGGILVGTYLVRFITASTLKRAFGVFLLAVGSLILYQNLGAVMPGKGTEVEEAAR
jgi:uncharacterized membrane protein YfcA